LIIIVDYGLGNLGSVLNMVHKVGGRARVSSDAKDILNSSKIILPGVGSFWHGISRLRSLKLVSAIQMEASRGTPILGICLGMQLLSMRSEEGWENGLGLIDAEVKRFSFEGKEAFRVPHVGWNSVRVERENPLIPIDGSEQRFYFSHSYHAVCKRKEDIFATTEYGYVFTSAYFRDNVYGVQFHPEKSHRFGMDLMKRFVEL